MKIHGSDPPCWPIRIIIGFIGWPNTGNELITPITGLMGEATREMARERSYSKSFSRCGDSAGRGNFWSR